MRQSCVRLAELFSWVSWVGTRTGTACDRGDGCSVGVCESSFLASDGLRYGAWGDHVQQILPLPVRQAGCLMASRVQIGNIQA